MTLTVAICVISNVIPNAIFDRRLIPLGLISIVSFTANIAIVSLGYCMGWTSPTNQKLGEDYATQSPLGRPITGDEEAWIGSLLNIGAIIGPFIGSLAASTIGRKWGLLSSSLPLFAGWIFVAVVTDVWMLYVGRIFWGVGVGMVFTISPMYCAEIATDDVRGALGSFLQMFITVGFLMVYAIGPYVSYAVTSYIGVAIVIVFVILFFFMPESPTYHLSKNDRESAAMCLASIRGLSKEAVQPELDKMAADVAKSLATTAKISDIWSTRANIKAMYVCCALLFFQQFCGINAVLFYMGNIFQASGSDLSAAVATIIIGAVQLGASCVTPLVVDRLGRRLLLLISSCGTAVGLGLLGMYFIMNANEVAIVSSLGFLPVLSLVLFIITYCVGLGPLPWAIMGELFAVEVKAVAAPIATAFCWILSFFITRRVGKERRALEVNDLSSTEITFFGPISDALGMHYAFWIFGICCVCSFVFTMFLVPETKGKSFQQIQDMLSGRTSKPTKEMEKTKA
ncbi:Facilitated trehalose transporter Tret1 [Eumeta japonica]|uniref:Facilitated trehalose transporter Tret1 n=1 Tax=Eumeta variegata TaxID=151549 RepID=A0A4C1TZ16_EUMVA|nr:Facilitated trehalose transporter Tret1 [Eumeta japonica]